MLFMLHRLFLQFSFHGEVLAAMQELQGTYAALLDTQDQLTATQQENEALKQRCSEFVKANLDHMLAWRSLKTKADALEGMVPCGVLVVDAGCMQMLGGADCLSCRPCCCQILHR